MFNNNRMFSDTVITIIKDDQSMLCLVENGLVSLPSTKIMHNTNWKNQSMLDIKEAIGLDLSPTSITKMFKISIPEQPASCLQCVFVLDLTPDMKKKCKHSTGKYASKAKWLTDVDILKYYNTDAICSHILLEFFPKMLGENSFLSELESTGILYEISDDYTNNDVSMDIYETTVNGSGLRAVQSRIYLEFMNNCFPNVFMSPAGFCKLINDWGVPKDDSLYLFRAADIGNRKFIMFKEFMYILSVLEPTTNHGGVSGEIRCRYIFRFFDRDQDGYINYLELKNMIIYMRKSKNLPVDQINVDKEQKAYSSSLNITPSKSMNLVDFLKYAGELKIRGLSQIIRFPRSVKNYLQMDRRGSLSNKQVLNIEGHKLIANIIDNNTYPKRDDFEIAVHSVKIQKSGTVINLEKIWTLNNVVSITTLQQACITKDTRRLSCEIHSEESTCNELIKYLRYLCMLNKIKSGNRGNRKDQYQWGNVTPIQYATKLIQVCTLLLAVMKTEPRLLDVRSPSYVFGDFHGNFGDLQYFEKMFWPLSPGFCPASLLFLGDYVDRGSYGVEVVTYLFCYKLLYPHKIHMVRGNHEIREIQKTFTFWNECTLKFGDKLGIEVWDTINNVFDVMPVAAVIDGKIFCCHGGVPPPWLCPVASVINNIPVHLNEPDLQSALAWDIMWNDPIREKQITPELDIELQVNEGFALNVKRGTAHVFNSDGLERFLNVNGFSHVIRAHEMVPSGYNVLLKGKLLTIFSTSRYNNGKNDASCILVDNGKIRMMRLDASTIAITP